MKKQVLYLFLLTFFVLVHNSFSQNQKEINSSQKVSKLFINQESLPIKLSYSNKYMKKNTNDSTYLKTDLSYKQEDGSWKTLEVELRARGNYRRKKCYFTPIKIKIKKSIGKGTLFEGNKKLKLVLPCLRQKSMNDFVLKEGMAYKLYEILSPYHFKTRMVTIDFTETRGTKTISHILEGFLIEDDKTLAIRQNGNVIKRYVHPLQQDAITSVQNSFFQYLIGNTDYSTGYQHNEKLFFIEKKTVPVPYDFDMCGLVDASYAVVPQTIEETLKITNVTERRYRGFKRDEKILQQVRKEFLDKKNRIVEIIDSFETNIENPKAFSKVRNFILEFFEVMVNDEQFNKKIISASRTK